VQRADNNLYIILICAALALAVFFAFEPIRHNEFVNYDDYAYVLDNQHVTGGLTRASVFWAFTGTHSGNWHPLTGLSHMLDCELFGLDPFWHHLTNLLFHIANTVLLFLLLKKMTGAIWQSAFVAAVFALHPLRVESVAWTAERKDVLSGLFWMFTIAAYIWYTSRPGIKRYLLVFSLLCLGLMAKPMLVTLPFVLLLLDYWPLGRLQWPYPRGTEAVRQGESGTDVGHGSSVLSLIAEKIPLFALAAVSSIVTFIVQKSASCGHVSCCAGRFDPVGAGSCFFDPCCCISRGNLHGAPKPLPCGWMDVVCWDPGPGHRSGPVWSSGDGRPLYLSAINRTINYGKLGQCRACR
jgi:hypothetical protein